MDKEERIKIELKQTKKNLTDNLDQLPQEDLPFMEPHLRSLYYQAYFLLAYGFYNASIVLSGIFLESMIKEKLFIEGITDAELEEMTFGQTITKCRKIKILKYIELIFLDEKRDIRNDYAHYNKMKLTEGIYFPTWKIDNPVEKLIRLDKRVKNGELTEAQARQELIEGISPELKSSKEFRPLSQIVKGEIDKEKAIKLFLEIDNFAREFAIKYFKIN